ncbi:alkaline shock response membrane anchor protein AmaP [Candidatus Enterococcus mansonii]|uniref:Alkaline shock response membrane anchor protein AmaP n=1 Tax=Candidatus Enterococcus mansonii TaxID=1834181 RepID=A0A242CGM9_9ENTE|nr:alkaline shock response membrane anchor protein AmaP [Enterococcus sp. 4G2_DIV0659]OTO09385.1 hypothetical protein A5880_000064 [Enterococcus sp. 4G2_DIV0659]
MRVIKALIALVLVAGILGIVGLYSQMEDLGVVTSFFHGLWRQFDFFVYFYPGVLLVVLFLLLLAFIVILFKPISQKIIHIKKEVGQINLPLTTLEAIAKSSLQGIVNKEDIQVKVRLTKKQLANVEVRVTDEKQQFLSCGHQIQEQITYSLQQMAMVKTNKINIVFKKKKSDTPILSSTKRESRVI